MDVEVLRVVGFDTAEDGHEAVLLTRDGEEEMRISCRNRVSSIENAFGRLMTQLAPGERLAVVLEAPRAHGRLVFEVASRLGCDMWQVGTVALNHYRDLEGQPRKDDHWDAFLAARMAFQRMLGCHVVSNPRPEERMLARLARARSRLSSQRVELMLQFRAILLELAPVVLHRDWKGPKYDSKAMRMILKRWPAFAGLGRSKRTTITGILRSCRYKRGRETETVDDVRRLEEEVVVPAQERAVMAMEIEVFFNQVELLERSIAELEAQLMALVKQHPIATKLMEMPGIGYITAAVLVGELLPVARNTPEASSATYAGVTPLSRKSGKSLNGSRLCRGSNKHILKALFLSSVASLQRSALDAAYYDKKRADYQGHPKPHTAAILALARQRHKVIYRLLTTDARYDKERLIASHLDRQRERRCA